MHAPCPKSAIRSRFVAAALALAVLVAASPSQAEKPHGERPHAEATQPATPQHATPHAEATHADTPDADTPHGAHADKATSNRRFDNVDHWVRVFDDPSRDAWQKPDALVSALGLRPGMSVADIGAGTGYLSRRLSAAVGESGNVFVMDVEPNLVAHLRERAEKEKTANVVPILGSAHNPRLPASSVDAVLFLDTYHHVDGRKAYLRVLRRSLRPGARVMIVEWKAGKQPVGPPDEKHKLPRESVIAEVTGAGFEQVPVGDFLPHQYVLLFRLP